MLCAIWHHLYNFKNVKNTHVRVFLQPAILQKVKLLHGCFSCFLNCTNGPKSHKASHIFPYYHIWQYNPCGLNWSDEAASAAAFMRC